MPRAFCCDTGLLPPAHSVGAYRRLGVARGAAVRDGRAQACGSLRVVLAARHRRLLLGCGAVWRQRHRAGLGHPALRRPHVQLCGELSVACATQLLPISVSEDRPRAHRVVNDDTVPMHTCSFCRWPQPLHWMACGGSTSSLTGTPVVPTS